MHDVRRRTRQRRRGRSVSIANARLNGLPGAAAAGRLAALVSLPNVLLASCVVIAVWFVFVPLSALIYNAFTEDTGFGPGAFSLDNFVEAYSSWHILRLFWNSLVFAVGTALTTLVMGALVAWVVERTDAPGGSLFHTLSLLSFAVPGLLMAMAWIFVFSPNIGWGNAVLKSAFGLVEAPVNIYSMAGMTWALSSHYFPLAYLVLGPALRALDVRMEEAALMAGGSYRQVFAKVTLPLLRPAILSALLLLFVMGMASYEVPRLIGRPARIDVFTTTSRAPSSRRRRPSESQARSASRYWESACSPYSSIAARRGTRNRSPPSPARAIGPRASSSDAPAGRSRSASAPCSSLRSDCRWSRSSGSRSSAIWRSRSSPRARRRRSTITSSS